MGMRISRTSQESVTEGSLQRVQRWRSSLESLEEFSDLQIERSIVTTIAVEGMFGADSAAFEEHTSGVEVTGEAGIVKGDRIPLVTGVNVDARF